VLSYLVILCYQRRLHNGAFWFLANLARDWTRLKTGREATLTQGRRPTAGWMDSHTLWRVLTRKGRRLRQRENGSRRFGEPACVIQISICYVCTVPKPCHRFFNCRNRRSKRATLFTSLPLDAVVRYDACDTTRHTDQNATKAVYLKQLVCTESPEARTTQDRSFITYRPKNHDGATRRTQHNNL
jgi:hypothetical protein